MNIVEEIENLAAKEREVRQLKVLIERVTSLNDEELAKFLAGLASARKDLGPNAVARQSATSTLYEVPGETPQRPSSARDPSTILASETNLAKTSNAV
jgi:hypothetical protein